MMFWLAVAVLFLAISSHCLFAASQKVNLEDEYTNNKHDGEGARNLIGDDGRAWYKERLSSVLSISELEKEGTVGSILSVFQELRNSSHTQFDTIVEMLASDRNNLPGKKKGGKGKTLKSSKDAKGGGTKASKKVKGGASKASTKGKGKASKASKKSAPLPTLPPLTASVTPSPAPLPTLAPITRDTTPVPTVLLGTQSPVTGSPVTPSPTSGIILYQNDFESPLDLPRGGSCTLLDSRDINSLYGTDENPFTQQFSVETVLLKSVYDGPNEISYSDPQGIGGNFSIGFLASAEDDMLALGFDTLGKNFLNVCMDVSSIDGPVHCGGPYGIDTTTFLVSLIDSPSGDVQLSGTVLDSATMSSPAGPNSWTLNWTTNSIALDASQSANGRVSIVWDLLEPAFYGVLDNLVIVTSDTPGDCSP